jgi:hypothetical protein
MQKFSFFEFLFESGEKFFKAGNFFELSGNFLELSGDALEYLGDFFLEDEFLGKFLKNPGEIKL